MSTFPVLSDDRIVLRPHRPEDCDPMYAAIVESIAELGAWLPWCHSRYAREETESLIKLNQEAWTKHSHYPFAILAADDAAFLGGIMLNQIVNAHRFANVGYWVRSSCTRQGIACAALRLVARYAFGNLRLTRLEIACVTTNANSRRVAEKVGARFEGVSRNRLVVNGVACDAAVYGLVPEDVSGDLSRST